jgi:short-subunit dehydrogenase
VLVTGASAGIGAAFARACAAHSESLLLVARRSERLEALAGGLDAGCRVEVLVADLASLEGQARTVEALRQGDVPDLLINNAGFSTLGPFAASDLDAELAMQRLHEDACLALTRAALPGMIEARRGAVINVSSIAALLRLPGVATYAATKAFLLSFTRSLHAELDGSGVQAQCLCPGYTRTEIHSRESFSGFDASRVPDDQWMEASEVVGESLAALATPSRWLVVPGEHNRALLRKSLGELEAALG